MNAAELSVLISSGIYATSALVFAAVTAPETKGRQLEEIQDYWANGGRWPASPAPVRSDALSGSAAPPTTAS